MIEWTLTVYDLSDFRSLVSAIELSGLPMEIHFISHLGLETTIDLSKSSELSAPQLDVWYFNCCIAKSYSRVFIKGTAEQLVLFRLYL